MKTINVVILHRIADAISRHKGWKRAIANNSHLNASRINDVLEGKKSNTLTLFRIIVNLAILMPRSEFIKEWNSYGEQLYDFAENEGDNFNNEFSSKK